MTDLHPHLRALRDTTEPTDAAVARVRQSTRRARRPRWPAPLALGLAAAAAAWLVITPSGPPPRSAPTGTTGPTGADLPADPPSDPPVVSAQWTGPAGRQDLGPHVQATVDGHGTVTGHDRDLAVDWVSGELRLAVDPTAGVALAVATEEARVVVKGTVFSIRRDALGTHTTVDEGIVELTCGDRPPSPLPAGEARTCLPRTASGWLRRATALDRAAEPAAVLTAAEQGLALAPPTELAIELRLHRATALLHLDRSAEARASLDALLHDHPDQARRVEQTLHSHAEAHTPPTAPEAP